MEKEPGWGVWFFLFFLFQTPIYTNQYGSSIAKTACRKKQHAHIEKLFTIKILIRRKPAVIKKFNLLAHSMSHEYRIKQLRAAMRLPGNPQKKL